MNNLRCIDALTAMKLLTSAAEKARMLNVKASIVVSDATGQVKASLRMDGAALMSMEVATNKAYSAIGLETHTHLWHGFIKDDAPLHLGLPHIDRLVVFGGGFVIKEGRDVVGAIGVSGGHYSQDMECARTAIEECQLSYN
jgi:uncharacterized protein GlcG (DUF336 family)